MGRRSPLFMSVTITPSLLGKAATLLYQQHPLYMRVARDQVEERYRIVPSMAERPFLVNPLLDGNYDVINLYASRPGKEPESVTFERPTRGPLEFRERSDRAALCRAGISVRGQRRFRRPACSPMCRAAFSGRSRNQWKARAPARVMIFHGTSALLVRAPSKIVMEIPENASSFSGYFGIPEEAYAGRWQRPREWRSPLRSRIGPAKAG